MGGSLPLWGPEREWDGLEARRVKVRVRSGPRLVQFGLVTDGQPRGESHVVQVVLGWI